MDSQKVHLYTSLSCENEIKSKNSLTLTLMFCLIEKNKEGSGGALGSLVS
ncbi:hypothetical protein QJS04_geneDACA003357 [Acorus gramineus]|uniref:Uncharacterized protein n=1 Tax=Acorus gramineus TaxID=55184 RepID=A0AAV9BNB0_ACOGR|nr:hypothetical protein QJS04_geneDACA003357 [Acorus gramineus]